MDSQETQTTDVELSNDHRVVLSAIGHLDLRGELPATVLEIYSVYEDTAIYFDQPVRRKRAFRDYLKYLREEDFIEVAKEENLGRSGGRRFFYSVGELYEKSFLYPDLTPIIDVDVPEYFGLTEAEWYDLREEIFTRDHHTCQACGTSKDELSDGSYLNIHHIRPAKEFYAEPGPVNVDEMNDPSNLITLCPSCHSRFEGQWKDLDNHGFAHQARSVVPNGDYPDFDFVAYVMNRLPDSESA